jgi:nicotinamide-nucleotide amidase
LRRSDYDSGLFFQPVLTTLGTMKPELQLKKLIMGTPPLTLAVAESLTAGHLQARIASVSGASNYFLGGITAYSLAQKVKHLRVRRGAAQRTDCVSQQVAVEMARGAIDLFGADIAVATTGYAEPNLAAGVKTPMAWWALCHQLRGGQTAVISGLIEMRGAKRVEAQEKIASEVLDTLVAYLQEWRADTADKKGRKKTRR